MGYKIVIVLIAIVAVLFTSGLALDSFAVQGPHFPIPEGKSAYFFDCSGLGGGSTLDENKVWDFIENNDGFFHRCGFNWINAAEQKCGDAGEPACQRGDRGHRYKWHNATSLIQDSFEGEEVNHVDGPTQPQRGHPDGWVEVLKQFDDIFPLPETGNNPKLLIRGYSWGGGMVGMMAAQERCWPELGGWLVDCDNSLGGGLVDVNDNIPSFTNTNFDMVWMVDPVGPWGFRGQLTHSNGIRAAEIPVVLDGTKVFGVNVGKVLSYYNPYGGLSITAVPVDCGDGCEVSYIDGISATGFDLSVQKALDVEQRFVGGHGPDWKGLPDARVLEDPPDPLDPGDETCPGNYFKGNYFIFNLGAEHDSNGQWVREPFIDGDGNAHDCHGGINTPNPENVIFNRGIDWMQLMNNIPAFSSLPEVIMNEGSVSQVAIQAVDPVHELEQFTFTETRESCPAGSTYNVNVGAKQCEAEIDCPDGTVWWGGDLCRNRVQCPSGNGPGGTPWGIGGLDNLCHEGLSTPIPNIGCPPGTTFSDEGLHWCNASVICPAGMTQQAGLNYCKSPRFTTTTIQDWPDLKLKAVEVDDTLQVLSDDLNENKLNCVSQLGSYPSGCPYDNLMVRNGNVLVFADDGVNPPVQSKILIQAEDNGFPCGNCTETIINQNTTNVSNCNTVPLNWPGGREQCIIDHLADDFVEPDSGIFKARGALGHYTTGDLKITVLNVKPTVNGFGSFLGNELRLILKTTDPSMADTDAGFDYNIDWGDGSPIQTISGNSTDVFNHFYQRGAYTVKVNATDKDDGISDEITLDVETPFWKLLQIINDLRDDGTLNKGNANSFTSKVNGIMGSLEKENFTPVCNVANALINEIKQGFEKPGKLPIAISGDLIEKIKEEKKPIGCNGGVIDVVKQTIHDGETDQFTFAGDVSGTIGDGQKIRLGNLTSGTYSTTETVSSGQTLANIFCVVDDYTEDLPTQTVTINLGENEYAVCVFFNIIEGEIIVPSFIGRGSVSTSSDTAISDIRLHTVTGSSNLSSPQTSDDLTDDKKGGGGDEHLTRPTFGVSHETFETIVDSGFRFNDQSFTINDNHHTPFAQQTVNIGEVNTFEAKIYADKRLKVQEFLFGIPNVGEAHLAELGVEVWYDYNGEIEEVKAVQKSNVIDKETIVATHEKTKCQASDYDEKCDVTNVSMVFLEPLQDKVMAVKAIDYKGRYQITYLNEGVEIAGDSLNPMQTYLIPSNIRDQGLIKVTQLAKYSPYWESDDGRMFEMNSFGSFKEINKSFERFQDTGTAYTRVHSGFGGVMAYELKRATGIFDASELISELPDFIPYAPPIISERMTDDMKAKMLEQEEIAKKIIEESKVQARW